MIAVFGASGTIGSRVVAALPRDGARIRAMVRKRPEQSHPGVEYTPVELTKAESVSTALEGVETVFLLCPNGKGQLAMELDAVRACVEKGVQRIVKLSAMGASPTSPIDFARLHGRVEEAIRASGCAWTFLRPNMFMQNLFWYQAALRQGLLPLPLGTAEVSHVDGDDVAAAAARALLKDEHAGKIYTLTGPEALSGTAVAASLSRVLGRTIQYAPVSSADFASFLKSAGEPDEIVAAEIELFAHWSQGHGSEATNAVAELTGAAPTTLEEFAYREKARLQ
jgi:uncharacterized protein YbjT (DUF2867 family)